MRYFIGDTETTGLKNARPVEIAMIEIDPVTLEIERSWESLIDPERNIEPGAQAIHGISYEMVSCAPTVVEFVETVLGGPIFEPSTLIGYNVQFDLPMFQEFMSVEETYCALRLCRRLFPTETQDHKLGTMADHLSLDKGTAHRAMSDVLVVHQMLRVLMPVTGKTLLENIQVPSHTVYTMPFGEHKGKLLADIPLQYRSWLLSSNIDKDLRKSLLQLRAAGI
jgi:DNA polymerase III epsilon subunit-like protein